MRGRAVGVARDMTSKVVQYRRYGGPEVLELVDREDPTPGPGQVPPGRARRRGRTRWTGSSAAAGWRPGTRRTGRGCPGSTWPGSSTRSARASRRSPWATRCSARRPAAGTPRRSWRMSEALVRKPAEVGWETAAALPMGATTAYRALALLGLGEGDHTGTTIVIDGAAGAVGVFAVQLAVARGATVIGSAGEAHQDELRALGATPVVYGEGLADRVRAVAPTASTWVRHLGLRRAPRPRRADGLPGEGDHHRRLRRRAGARRHVHLRRRPGRRAPRPDRGPRPARRRTAARSDRRHLPARRGGEGAGRQPDPPRGGQARPTSVELAPSRRRAPSSRRRGRSRRRARRP